MRKCSQCKLKKELIDFHINKTKPLGREYVCRECAKKNNKKRDSNQLRKNQKLKSAYKSKLKYPLKVKTRKKTEWLIKKGEIKKTPCIFCGDILVDAHHENYKDAYDILFLCKKHHSDLHNLEKIEGWTKDC